MDNVEVKDSAALPWPVRLGLNRVPCDLSKHAAVGKCHYVRRAGIAAAISRRALTSQRSDATRRRRAKTTSAAASTYAPGETTGGYGPSVY